MRVPVYAQWQIVWTASNFEFRAASQRNHAFASDFIRILFIKVLCEGNRATRAFYWVRASPRSTHSIYATIPEKIHMHCSSPYASLDPLFLLCTAHISTDIQGLSMDLANDWMHSSMTTNFGIVHFTWPPNMRFMHSAYYVGPFMRALNRTHFPRNVKWALVHFSSSTMVSVAEENGEKKCTQNGRNWICISQRSGNIS